MISILSIGLFLVFGKCQTVNFKVIEESAEGTVIGNIAYLHPLFTKAFYIINSPFLRLSEKGDLMLKSRIDLEKICSQYEVCCGDVECVVKGTIIAKDKTSDQSETINIHLTISDKNDNSPSFSKPKQTIQVGENEPIGFYLYLEQAHDADVSPTNKITHYSFKESTSTFELDQSRLPSIGLIVKRPLDYEMKSLYLATLEACDIAKQCTSQSLEIHIQDRNDNFPIFLKQDYEIEILENFPVGQQIMKVEAVDKDSSLFNKILYGFHENGDTSLRSTFIITENTGSIKLLKKLSARIRQKYKFKVSAVDKMAMSSHKALANVCIKVKDLNDNSPIITSLNGDSKIEINETDPPKELFTIQVTDKDIGVNANVSCQLLQQYANDFRLDLVGNEIYILSSTRSFDHEIEKHVKAVVECYDHGIPRNTVQKPFIVYIKDVNEFSPHFDKDFQKLRLLENRPPGFFVLQVNATDKDDGAVLRYAFMGDGNIYFTIDSETGEIRSARRNLDRESLDKVEINILVTDAVENPRSGQCTVIIEILDENDNAPRFLHSQGPFNVSENMSIFSKVKGQIIATDEDKDEINNKVLFKLLQIFDSRNEIVTESVFKITEIGDILTLQRLDREENTNYTLEIRAYDTGLPTMSTKMNFTIQIQDENDNPPKWINPQFSNNYIPTLNLSGNIRPGQIIIKLEALDPDFGDNSRLFYSIMNNNKLLFTVNDTNGELRVARTLPIGSIKLYLRATDYGQPPKYSENNILIYINEDQVATLNRSIIVVLIVITGFISVFLIIAIVCVRQRPRYNNTNTIDSQNNQDPSKSSCIYNTGTWKQYPDDSKFFASGNFLSDNASALYYPIDVDSSVPMNTFVSKLNIPHPLINYPTIDNCYYPSFVGTCNSSQTTLVRTQNPSCCDMISTGSVGRFNDIDDDSADSGKGGSEDDNGLHQIPLLGGHHNTFNSDGKNRLYTTIPYQTRMLNNGRLGSKSRAIISHTLNQCPCYILPEDSVIQSGQNTSTCHYTSNESGTVDNVHPVFDTCTDFQDSVLNTQQLTNLVLQDYSIGGKESNSKPLSISSQLQSSNI